MSEEDVEQFLWDLERALSHLDGDKRRKVMQDAEDALHEAATQIAENEGADQVQWYHYVQASAHLGPPERFAADLTGEPLPETGETARWPMLLVAGLALVIVAMVSYAALSTGDLHPVGSFSGTEDGLSESRSFTVNVSQAADSVFVRFQLVPSTQESLARITILDGANHLVYEEQAMLDDSLETARFLEGEPGTWRIFIDFEDYTGSWLIEAREER